MTSRTAVDPNTLTSARLRDFPFYRGAPIAISGRGWALVVLGCLLGFAALMGTGLILKGEVGRWLSILLFVALPLAGLRLAAGPQWSAPFPPLRARDVWIGLAFVPVTVMASAAAALLIMHSNATAANPALAQLAQMRGGDAFLFMARTLPQLLGEELVTILPFLAILTLCHQRLKSPRAIAILMAWLLSAIIFGALHLSTYNWNLVQAFGVIGVARLALTLPFIITKSIWASTITHVANDWLLFGIVAGATALHAGGVV